MKIVLAGLTAIVLFSLAVLGWGYLPTEERFYTDADSIKQPLESARTRDILWQPPAKLSEPINTGGDDYEPRISADGLTLFFVRGKAGENSDIYFASRAPGGWSDPQPLVRINTEHEELGPEPAPDGESLYFYSDRPGGLGGYDLWVTRMGPNGWREAENLGPRVNTAYNEYGPAVTPDGETLYYASNRPRPDDAKQPNPDAWAATIREDLFHRDYDLYASPITEAGAGAAEAVAALNSPYNEGAPCVSPFGDFIYFGSDRPGGEGSFDLYRSRRLRGEHTPPVNLGPAVNTPANELDAGLALGGYGLYFSSDRDAVRTETDQPQADRYDIFYTTSREVFVESETLDRDIAWAGLWEQIGPNLLWLLLLLLLLLALAALWREARDRRLSLLVKCLLASLFAHLLVMLLLNFWQVTAEIADALQRRGGTRVALVSSPTANDIATQIRGALTEVSSPDAPEIASQRSETTVEIEATREMTALDLQRAPLETNDQPDLEVETVEARLQADEAPPRAELVAARSESAEVALPLNPQRADASEPRSISRPAPAKTDAPNQPLDREAVLVAARTFAQADIRPRAVDTREAPAGPQSLARMAATDDTIPQPSPIRPQAAAPLDAAPIAVDVEIPNAPAQQTERGAETPPAVATVSTEAPRRETGGELVRGPANRQFTRIQPQADATEFIDAVLVGHARSEATDAIPAPTDPTRLALKLSAPAVRVSVDLPSLDQARTTASRDEPTPRAAAAAPVAPRQERTLDPADSPTLLELDQVAPAADRTPSTDTSLSDAVAAVATDALPAAATPDTHRMPNTPHVATIDFDLPSLDEERPAGAPVEPVSTTVMLDHEPRRFDRATSDLLDSSSPRETSFEIDPLRLASTFTAGAAPETPAVDLPAFASFAPAVVELLPTLVSLRDSVSPGLPGLPALRLPAEVETHENPFAQRDERERGQLVEAMGGSDESAVEDPIGTIRGTVTDADTGQPLWRAAVRLDLPDADPVIATTGLDGSYILYAPELPDFFALTVSREGYIPEARNVPVEELEGRTLDLDFALRRERQDVVPVESSPEVHHLGNDRFTGRVNSQFQRDSEGRTYSAEFTLTKRQLRPHYESAELRLLTKGVQCPHDIIINGAELYEALEESPDDGSFGEFTIPFDIDLLGSGINTIAIQAISCRGDLDDFEFVNLQVHLSR